MLHPGLAGWTLLACGGAFVDSGDRVDGGASDGGGGDGGAPDGGAPDGGTPDGGAPDGGAPDGGDPDGGASDGGGGDGGGGDGGADGGLPTGEVVIGFWCGPPAAEMNAARMDEIAAAGFNRVSNACDGTTYVPSYNLEMLALAEARGLEVVVTDGRGLDAAAGNSVDANLDGLVADYAGSSALRGYHVYDEPGTAAFAALATVREGLAVRDPLRFTSINLLPDYASAAQLGTHSYDAYVSTFLAQVQPSFFTYDHYPFLADGTDGPSFFANLAVVRAQALAAGIPFGQYLQAISYSGHRATTGPEKRWAAMHTLAYGGTGVFWFTYWTPPQTSEGFGDGIITAEGLPGPQYAEVSEINRDVAAIGAWLAAARSTEVFHNGALAAGTVPRVPGEIVYIPTTAPLTVGIFQVEDGAYALIVNRDYLSITESDLYFATADGRVELFEPDLGSFVSTHGTIDALGTRVHLALEPGAAVLVHLPGPLAEGPIGAEAYFGTVRADAGWLDVVDARFGTLRLRTAGWDDCPAGTTLVGRDFQSDGFWLCAPDALAARTYYVGNVVHDVGALYRVVGGSTTALGPGGWDECPAGTLLGRRFESDGYWICME